MPKIVDKARKFQEIIEAAFTIFSKSSIADTTIATIAKASNMGKGSFYEYFHNKNALICAMVEYSMQSYLKELSNAIVQEENAKKKLRCFVEIALDEKFLKEVYIKIWVEFLHLASVEHNEQAVVLLENYYEESEALLVNILQAGIEAKTFKMDSTQDVARTILAHIDALYMHYLIKQDQAMIHNMLESFMQTLLYGIKTKD